MNRKYSTVIFAIVIAIFILTNFALSQDSQTSKTSEEFVALKKGSKAINFEFGSLLFRTSSSSSSDYYNYEVLLTFKTHLSDKLALRVSGGTELLHQSGTGESSSQIYTDNSVVNDNYSFSTSVNFQYFLSLNSKVKPFFSAGIYANYLNSYNNALYGFSKREDWGVGPIASFGVEMFVLDNISLIGEYVIKATVGKSYYKSNYFDNSYSYTYQTAYKLDLKTVRIGASVYF